MNGHRGWTQAWRSPELRESYDVIVIGAGGHGLATAYYLAKNHGITDVAVLEKGWLGLGNSGRNTQVTRSNYFWPESAAFFDRSLCLYEGLGFDLNFNVMLSQRGILTLAHSHHEMDALRRWANAIQVNRIDSELMTPAEIKKLLPLINLDSRFPLCGGFIQRRGGISRHDAVVWGFARAANALGVDIVQQCEVTGFDIADGRVTRVLTTRGPVRAGRVCVCVAGHTSVLAKLAGFRVPITSMALQAMVSEPLEPCINGRWRGHLQQLRPARRNSGSRRYRCRGAGSVSSLPAGAADAPVGRHRRYHTGHDSDHGPDPGAQPLHQRRLGHRRLQGHSGRRGDDGIHRRA